MDRTLVYDSGSNEKCGCSPLEAVALGNGGFGGMNSMLPAMMMGGCNGGFGGGMWNNPIWAIVFLAFLRNGGLWGNGDGNGNCGCGIQSQLSQIQETLTTQNGNQMLMSAITGNATSIKELASTINCDFNAVQTAINGVQSAICNLGSKNDMNAMQIVNAINGGNAALANQLSSCCCDVKQLVTNQGYENRLATLQQTNAIQNGFAQVGYAAAEQTCAIKQNTTDNTSRILAKLDAIEDSRKDREIASLTAALTAANSRAERAAELAPINKALADIACKQPSTVTTAYSPFVAVPNCVAYNAGLYGAGQFGLGGSGIFG
ncbi:MAG: hypothetical protein KBT34_02940 [Prevotella sp.]|nr:hypothetical protein [Candidatus Prevotella equi]